MVEARATNSKQLNLNLICESSSGINVADVLSTKQESKVFASRATVCVENPLYLYIPILSDEFEGLSLCVSF